MPQRSSASAPLNTFATTASSNSTVTICFHDNIGKEVLVETRNGDKYEGILAGYSADKEIGLVCAYKLSNDGEDQFLPKRSEMQSKMKFPPSSYVTLSLILSEDRNVREFATDADYHDRSRTAAANGGEHPDEFEVWHDDEHEVDDVGTIEDSGAHTGGWAVQDMFEQNGSRVKSDFLDDLSQYTTVEVGDVSEEARRQADRIARDIEASAGSRRNQLLENDDEERDLDKMTEFDKDKDYIAPQGRRANRHQHVRGNAAAPRGGPGGARGRGGRQFGNPAQQNFASQQQYGSTRGGYQNRPANVGGAPRYSSERQNGSSTMPPAGEPWRQPNMNMRRPAEQSIGSYSSVVAAGMKQTSPSASNDVRMSSGNAPPNRIVETGASVSEKNPATRNKRTEDLRNWGSTFDKAYSQPEAAQNAPVPASRPGNAWQSGPPHRGRNNAIPTKADDSADKKAENKKPEAAEGPQTPTTSDAEKAKADEAKKADATPTDPSPEAPATSEAKENEETPAKPTSTFKFNPNAQAFVPKSAVSQPQPQPAQQMVPMMPVMVQPPAPASSGFAPTMVMSTYPGGPQTYAGPAVIYQQGGQVFTAVPQSYSAVVPPQSQPQPSGAQTPNGSTTGIANASQQNASNPANPQQQQPQRPGSVSRQQSQGAAGPIYAAQFQPGMQQPTAVYAPYAPQQVYPQMHLPYHYQGGYPIAAGQPPVTSTAGQNFSNVQQSQVTQYHVHQQQAVGMPHQQHPGGYGHMQQGAPYHSQSADVSESQAQSTNGSTSSSVGCQRPSKPATPQPVPSQPQQMNGSGMASSATSGYNTPHPGTPQPQPQQQPPVAQMAPQQAMYPMHGQNAPSIFMYQPQPGHQVFQIPAHQGQFIQYQQPRNSSFPPQNVMYAQAPLQQQAPQQVNMQNS